MYPTLFDLVHDLFGFDFIPFKLVQSYGMMVALGFVAGSLILSSELKRKEHLGLLSPIKKMVWTGRPSTVTDKVISAAIGFLLGFKLVAMFLDFDNVASDPQDFILSSQGNLIGGIIGALLSVGLRLWEDHKENLAGPKEVELTIHPHEQVGTITIIAAVAGILGAKLFHNLENIDQLIADPMGSLISFSGMSFFGGLLCAAALIVRFARKNGIKVVHLTDAAVPGLVLAYGIGRIGCQLAGDGDWGIPNDLPMPEWLSFLPDWMWSFDYPNNVLGIDLIQDYAQMGLVSLTGRAWPTPFYETVMAVCIFAFLWVMRKRWTTPGMVSSVYLLLIGIERLGIEQIRINNHYHVFGFAFTQAEMIAVLLMIAGVLGIYFMPKVGKRWAKW